MTLLADLRNFFVREKLWGLLLLFTVGAYAALLLWPERTPEKAPSEAVERLQLAEKKLKEEILSEGGVQEFLAERPKLLHTLNLLTLFLFGALVVGLGIDLLWFMRPSWRARFRVREVPPEGAGWTVGTVFKIILLFVLVSLALNLLLFVLKSAVFQNVSRNFFVLFHTTISDLAAVWLILYFIRGRGGNWRDLGFRGVRWLKDFGVGLAGYMAILPPFFLTLAGLIVWAHFFAYEPPPHPLVEVFLEEERRAPGLVAYSIFLACVAGPILEEIFFRGFCYPAFKKRWGGAAALLLSASFFALIHQNVFAFLPIFILGLGLGYLYEKRGTLVPCIVLHVVHNSVFIGYFFLVKEVLTGA